MPISEVHAGRRYPPSASYDVSTAKIAEFSAALGEPEPADIGERMVAPPTFAAVMSHAAWRVMFEDPELGLALHRIVHGDQRFTFGRLLRAGDRVTATLVIEKVRCRGTVDIITVSVELRSGTDELVCIATATLFHSRESGQE